MQRGWSIGQRKQVQSLEYFDVGGGELCCVEWKVGVVDERHAITRVDLFWRTMSVQLERSETTTNGK